MEFLTWRSEIFAVFSFFKLDELWLKLFHTFQKIKAKLLNDNLNISHIYCSSLNVQYRVFRTPQQTNG